MNKVKEKKIKIGVSGCLLGQNIRFDRQHKFHWYINEILGRYFDYVSICPEVEIGMGIPRKTVRLVGDLNNPEMIEPISGTNWTTRMHNYNKKKLPKLYELSGFLFKKGSPSCGVFRTKVYQKNGIPLVANISSKTPNDFKDEYAKTYMAALAVKTTAKKHSDALQHIKGFLKKIISGRAKEDILRAIESYRKGYIPLIAPITVTRETAIPALVFLLCFSFSCKPQVKKTTPSRLIAKQLEQTHVKSTTPAYVGKIVAIYKFAVPDSSLHLAGLRADSFDFIGFQTALNGVGIRVKGVDFETHTGTATPAGLPKTDSTFLAKTPGSRSIESVTANSSSLHAKVRGGAGAGEGGGSAVSAAESSSAMRGAEDVKFDRPILVGKANLEGTGSVGIYELEGEYSRLELQGGESAIMVVPKAKNGAFPRADDVQYRQIFANDEYDFFLASSVLGPSSLRSGDLTPTNFARESQQIFELSGRLDSVQPGRTVTFNGSTLTVERKLGAGGSGTIFEARVEFPDGKQKNVVVKVVGEEYEFELEVSTFREFNGSNYFPLFYGSARTTTGQRVIIMEKGVGSLEDHIKSEVSLSHAEVAEIFDGFALLHEAGYAHADVKPGNFLIMEDGRIVLADFGSTRKSFVGDKDTPNTTDLFAAPERASVKKDKATGRYQIQAPTERNAWKNETLEFDPFKGDMFSVGVSLYRERFRGNISVIKERLEAKEVKNEDLWENMERLGDSSLPNDDKQGAAFFISEALKDSDDLVERVIGRMLSPDPTLRPSPAELRTAAAELRSQ